MKKVAAIFTVLAFVGTGCINIPNLPKAAHKRKGPLVKEIDNAYKNKQITLEERNDLRDRVHEAAARVDLD